MTNYLKPEPIECECGCGLVGQPRSKVWVGESVGHVIRCRCRKCQGGRQRAKSRVRENKVAKDLGGQREPGSGIHSGIDVNVTDRHGPVVWIEETANKALVAGVRRWWTGKGTTAKMSRIAKRGNAMGVPVAFVASWGVGDGGASPRVAVMDYESFKTLVEMASDNG